MLLWLLKRNFIPRIRPQPSVGPTPPLAFYGVVCLLVTHERSRAHVDTVETGGGVAHVVEQGPKLLYF